MKLFGYSAAESNTENVVPSELAEITQEAEAFCKNQGKEMDVVRTDIQHPALGKPGSATLEFRCKQKSQ